MRAPVEIVEGDLKMAIKSLYPGERVILSLDNAALVLTTLRIRVDLKMRGGTRLMSMTLNSVASCGIVTSHTPLLIVLAVVLAVMGFIAGQGSSEAAAAMIFGSVVSIIAYFVTRRTVLSVASAGEHIVVPLVGSSRAAFLEMIDALESAKLDRENGLMERQAAESGQTPGRLAG
jgi:hypothetical protein